ncbi:MAG: hypothetical protein Q7J58_09410 [Hydrogenophaga sp.]|uniref:hypothetical protein n=1 Tax=Hydrogenophaga sp. TaxID=1904254 RepID=UPI0027184752|nr:hypothetical protein [Hydrogenophaga sp.]MDO9569584.1 hypothetical protein [Hydrogenophaga sp.]
MTNEISELQKNLNSLNFEYRSDRKAIIWSFSVFAAASLAFFGFTYSKIESILNEEFIKKAKEEAENAVDDLKKKNKEASDILEKIRTEISDKKIIRRRSVLTFTHPEGGYNEREKQEWSQRYYHIKTPIKKNSDEMWRYDLTGYSYGIGKPLSFTWVGYTYSDPPDIRKSYASDNTDNKILASQYFGQDNYLYLQFGPISQYFNSFVLDYQSGSTGEKIQKHDEYSVRLTENNVQIK